MRRRLPFIVVCDDGCDPRRTLDDFGNLVRKARIDFDAEIRAFDAEDIAQHVPAPMRPHIGTLEELQRIDPVTGVSPRAAVLAWVKYADRAEPSVLLLLKPTMTGRESVDVLDYHAQHPEFPQESTMDQFFDEAQWESYNKLGQLLNVPAVIGTPRLALASFWDVFTDPVTTAPMAEVEVARVAVARRSTEI